METFGLALTFAVLVSANREPARDGREYSYIVSIHKRGESRNFLCAGSLIATAWVLTTAQCLSKFACRIRHGDLIATHNTTYLRILQRIHHKNSRSYHSIKASNRLTPKSNNVGLAKIEELRNVKYGQLSGIDYSTLFGHEVNYFEVGFEPVFKAKIYESNRFRIYGKYGTSNSKRVKLVRGVNKDIDILRVGRGIAMLCEGYGFPGPSICVAYKCSDDRDGEGSVDPDYGAPLIHDNKIVAITSEVEDVYSRHTPVSLYLDWIESQMQLQQSDNPQCRSGACLRNKMKGQLQIVPI